MWEKHKVKIFALLGIIFSVKFAFFSPTVLSPYWVVFITVLLFGPGVISILKKDDKDDDEDK